MAADVLACSILGCLCTSWRQRNAAAPGLSHESGALEICVKLCLEDKCWSQDPLPTLTVNDLNQEPGLRHTVFVFKFNFGWGNVAGAVAQCFQERAIPTQIGTCEEGGGLAIGL